MLIENEDGQVMLFDPDLDAGKTSLARSAQPPGMTSKRSSRSSFMLRNHTFMLLDLRPGAGNILGPCWEYNPVWLGPLGTLNTSECPKGVVESSLSQILVDSAPSRYYLSQTACLGILRRAEERGKELPWQLEQALRIQAGLETPGRALPERTSAFAINQRREARDLKDKSVALTSSSGTEMQTFITQAPAGFLPESSSTARDIGYQIECAPTLKAGGKSSAVMLPAAGFAEYSNQLGLIGYQEECASTLKAGGIRPQVMLPTLCLNDQGGQVMDYSEEVSGTLRAQEHGHQPLVFENHGIDARYTGPYDVAPTMAARYGTGGNNTPLVAKEIPFCITGNAIDRKPENGGNGLGIDEDISFKVFEENRHIKCESGGACAIIASSIGCKVESEASAMGLLSKLFGANSEKVEVKSPSFEVSTRDDIPGLQGDYAKAIFLWGSGKSSPVRGKDEYSRYLLTECGIRNVPAFHRDMIKQGYLEKDDEVKSLQNLKVVELKDILTSLGLPVTGKKDALIQRIMDSGKTSDVLKQYPDTFSLSAKGAEFLSAHEDYVQLHRHKVWDISWQEYDTKHKPGQSFNDTAWGILNSRAVKDTRLFGRVEYYFMYEILRDEGRRAEAIQMLLRVLYLDLSGVSGIPSYDMCRRKIISKKDLTEHFEAYFIIAPGIIEPIAEYRDVYTDDMVDKLYVWKLPVQVCSKKTFLKLVHAGLDGNFNTKEIEKELRAEYLNYVKSL